MWDSSAQKPFSDLQDRIALDSSKEDNALSELTKQHTFYQISELRKQVTEI